MSSIQSVIATSFQFTPPIQGLTLAGAVGGVSNNTPGLLKRYYSEGYHNDDPTWFNGKTPDFAVADNLIFINNTNTDNYSVMWTGYFYVPNTGIYRFRTDSDDGSYVWMGTDAVSGSTVGNSIVNNGGPHGITGVNSNYYQMTAGDYYPIRVIFGEIGGGDYMNLYYEFNNNNSWSSPGDAGLLVYNNATTEGFN